MTELAFVLGTVSEAIRLAPVIRACERRDVELAVIDTGERRFDGFERPLFDRLGLTAPDVALDVALDVGSGSDGAQTGMMLVEVERALAEVDPDVAVVHGDANGTLAGAIAASKMRPDVARIGAGCRSFDRTSPAETNRVVPDHVADYLFAPTEKNRWYLVREGITELRITVTGSTAVDALEHARRNGPGAAAVLDDLGLVEDGFLLVSVHGRANVDDPDRFRRLLQGAARAGGARGLDVVYPVHPRARERMERFGLDVPPGVRTTGPREYAEFAELLAASATVITDSGAVQEEACALGVPCVTLGGNTERPETTEIDANRLSQCSAAGVYRAVTETLAADPDWDCPYGDGGAAERILDRLPVSAEREELVR